METPSTRDDEKHVHETLSLSSSVFKRLQWIYLIGYLLAAVGDNLQGSYHYALYDSYGITRPTIELFYVISYASSLIIGTFAASLADRYGRRLACILSALFYILKNISLHFRVIWILVIGCVFWGIGNAFYHTGFEAWLIQEHRERSLDVQSLRRILRNTFVSSALVSIGTGILAQFLVQLSGYTAPFDVAIIFFAFMIIFTWQFWSENYGDKEEKPSILFISAIRILQADPRIVLLGFSSALFDASLYIFVIEWTPTLQAAKSVYDHKPLPLGFIFALFMFFDMIGAFIFGPLAKRIRVQSYMIGIFLLAIVGFLVPIIVPHSFTSILTGFLLFEVCVGLQRPSFSLMRSQYIPNEVRATIMNYMRVPQIIIMLVVLLSHFSLSTVFILCICMNLLAMFCMVALRGLKLPEEQAHLGEAEILIEEPSSPSFKMKRPQMRASSTVSLIPQVSSKSEDDNQSTSGMNDKHIRPSPETQQ